MMRVSSDSLADILENSEEVERVVANSPYAPYLSRDLTGAPHA